MPRGYKQGVSNVRATESLFLSKVPFYHKSVVYILSLSSPNFIENGHILCFLTIKCQLINSLSHFCFEKMPRSWEFMHAWNTMDTKNVPILQANSWVTAAPPMLPVIRVALLHTQWLPKHLFRSSVYKKWYCYAINNISNFIG